MLTVIFSLMWYKFEPSTPEWLDTTLLSIVFIIDIILESCGLIALYNLFTRL